MSGFDPEWLSLREPADRAARDQDLLRRAADLAARRGPAVVADLGAGTGSMLRALGPLIAGGQAWRLIDRDPVLLAEARSHVPAGMAVETVEQELAGIDALPLDGASLVTASALFDLVPEAWLRRFAARIAALGVPLYAALTFDGHASWAPAHARDGDIAKAFNRHQRTDKGMGPALGPNAAPRLAELMRGAGYAVFMAESPWVLDSTQCRLQQALAEGYARAARELEALPKADIAAWLDFRRSEAVTGATEIGHLDLLAIPPAPKGR